MKKLYFLFCSLLAGITAMAQTIPNGGMETWRTSTSGAISPQTVYAPYAWYGEDSLIIAYGQEFGTGILMMPPNSWHPQLFEENTIVHSGAHSAKLITVEDSLLGASPAVLTNAIIGITIDIASMTINPPTYSGGTPVSSFQVDTVSAWVEYIPGFDSGTHVHGTDTGTLTVQAISIIDGIDSVIGTGFVSIPPTATFTQIFAPVIYTLPLDSVALVRIFFTSGDGGTSPSLDSSILYVDDVNMTGTPYVNPAGVKNVTNNNIIKVYPNPANGTLYITGTGNSGLVCKLYAVNGQLAATKTLTGNDAMDISYLPEGMYFYTITDNNGKVAQSGKVTISR